MELKEYKIAGMSCQHCVMALKKELEQVTGIRVESVDVGKVRVAFDSPQDEGRIIEAITEAGYGITA